MTGILFDLDGTLLDTLQDIADSVNYALRQMGLPEKTTAEVRRKVGNGIANLIKGVVPEDKGHLAEKTLDIFRPYYAAHSQVKSAPYEGIAALAERLCREGYVCGVVSNKPDRAVKELTGAFFPAFSLAWGEQEGIARKPDPDGIVKAVEALGGSLSSCLYVGDSDVDVITAKNAGIPCIAVTWGFRDREDLMAAGAEHVADSADELYERICTLL